MKDFQRSELRVTQGIADIILMQYYFEGREGDVADDEARDSEEYLLCWDVAKKIVQQYPQVLGHDTIQEGEVVQYAGHPWLVKFVVGEKLVLLREKQVETVRISEVQRG